ncbi:Histone deacetylase 8 [Kappamyces sp. JEL0680]|nr:Histone deacetylase 8 [Kappamyces sp. JEL0680]
MIPSRASVVVVGPTSLPTIHGNRKRDEFGFVDDGALFEGIQEYVAKATGATLYCVQRLLDRDCLYAMHWEGGRCVIVIIDHRHHAKRDVASGFCYINDIVLAIYELSAAFDPILYIDIDIHHGDGLAQATDRRSGGGILPHRVRDHP